MVKLENPLIGSFEENIKPRDLEYVDLKKEKFLFYFRLRDAN